MNRFRHHRSEADKAVRDAEDAKRRAEDKQAELEPLFDRLERTAKRNAIFESIITTLNRREDDSATDN